MSRRLQVATMFEQHFCHPHGAFEGRRMQWRLTRIVSCVGIQAKTQKQLRDLDPDGDMERCRSLQVSCMEVGSSLEQVFALLRAQQLCGVEELLVDESHCVVVLRRDLVDPGCMEALTHSITNLAPCAWSTATTVSGAWRVFASFIRPARVRGARAPFIDGSLSSSSVRRLVSPTSTAARKAVVRISWVGATARLAPYATKLMATLRQPCAMAQANGVLPDPSKASISAPARARAMQGPKWPPLAARCSGVRCALSLESMSQPAAANHLMTLACLAM